jgi:hypothetical protein
MVDEIPLKPHEQLARGKMRTLLEQLATDFPDAPQHLTEQAVHQAAALLWPGMNLEALIASASMLVRSSLK